MNGDHRPDRECRREQIGDFPAQQCRHQAQRTAMGDDDAVVARLAQRGASQPHPRDQLGAALSARRRETDRVTGPRIETVAWHEIPAPPLPRAEIELLQPVIDNRVRRYGARQPFAPSRRASDDPSDPARGQCLSHRLHRGQSCRAKIDIQTAVTNSRRNVGRGMAHQDQLHA